jgi:ribose transport system permease protein
MTAPSRTAAAADIAPRRRSRLLWSELERVAILGVWGLMVLAFGLTEPSVFLTSSSFQTIFNSQAALVFLSMALLCTFVIGEFLDLSVASVLGLSAMIVPVLTVLHGVNVVEASLIAVAVGLACGLINATLVVVVGVNPIVVTLGMSTLLTGVALWISDLNTISGLSGSYSNFANASFLGLPLSFYYGVVITLVFAYVLYLTPLGRHMKFLGANREVSRLAGVAVNRIRFGAFLVSGLISAVGGVVLVSSLRGFDPESSAVYLLPTFAAVFLGTAVIDPGEFNPLGAFVGVYFLETGIIGLQELGYGGWVSDVFYGAALVVAVTISTIVRRTTKRG